MAPPISDRPGSLCRLANRDACYATDVFVRTSLYLAPCSRKLGAINLLLEAGATMQCADSIDTPANVSAYKVDVNCMRAFISAGFDINTKWRGGRTILHEALCGRVQMVTY